MRILWTDSTNNLISCIVDPYNNWESFFVNASRRKKVEEASVVKMTPNPQQGILNQDFQISLPDRNTNRILTQNLL
jgi:hypothetical protein